MPFLSFIAEEILNKILFYPNVGRKDRNNTFDDKWEDITTIELKVFVGP